MRECPLCKTPMVPRTRIHSSTGAVGGTVYMPGSISVYTDSSKITPDWYWECPKCGYVEGY